MKKIQCFLSEEKMGVIDSICEKNGYTRAELNRRALDLYLGYDSINSEELKQLLIYMIQNPKLGIKIT
jgi:hypothetical protein